MRRPPRAIAAQLPDQLQAVVIGAGPAQLPVPAHPREPQPLQCSAVQLDQAALGGDRRRLGWGELGAAFRATAARSRNDNPALWTAPHRRRPRSLLAILKRPFVLVVGEAVLQGVSHMIADRRMRLASSRTHRPPAHLQVARQRQCRTQHQHAGEARRVEAFGKQIAVEQDIDAALGERGDRRSPLDLGGRSVDMAGADPGVTERRGQRLAVRDVDRVAERRTATAMAAVMLDRVAMKARAWLTAAAASSAT